MVYPAPVACLATDSVTGFGAGSGIGFSAGSDAGSGTDFSAGSDAGSGTGFSAGSDAGSGTGFGVGATADLDTGVPQFLQNFAPSESFSPHFLQYITIPPLSNIFFMLLLIHFQQSIGQQQIQ